MRESKGSGSQRRTPDDLREMVQLTTPGAWIALTAVLLLLSGLLVYGIFGTVTVTVDATAAMVDGRLLCFVPENQAGVLSPGMRVIFESGQTGTVSDIGQHPITEKELDEQPGKALLWQRLGLSGLKRELVLTAEDLPGTGLFPLAIVREEKRPIDFLLGGGQ